MPEKEHEYTPEEITKAQKERTLSDAELIKDGAEYVMDKGATEPRLDVTDEQRKEIRSGHLEEIADKTREKAHNAIIRLAKEGGLDGDTQYGPVVVSTKDGREIKLDRFSACAEHGALESPDLDILYDDVKGIKFLGKKRR